MPKPTIFTNFYPNFNLNNMKKSTISIGIFAVLAVFFTAFSPFAPQHGNGLNITGYAGSPSEGNCTSCHSGTVNQTGGSIAITSTIPSGGYTPGQTYQVTVTVAKSGVSLFGFEVEALNSSNTNAGTLAVANTTETQLQTAANGRTEIMHKTGGGATANSHAFVVNWTAPTTNVGTVTFYAAGNATNSNGSSSGDFVYTTSKAFTPLATVEIAGTTTVCAGSCRTLTASVVNGTAGATYSYAWSNQTQTAANTVCPTATTTYTVTASTATGASLTRSVTVTVNNPTPVAIDGVLSFCQGYTTDLHASAGAGIALPTFVWSNGQTGEYATTGAAGIYTVTATNANGCTSTASAQVTADPAPVAQITGSSTICPGAATTLTGTGGLIYEWSNGSTNTAITVTAAGTYTVTVTNDVGCQATATRTVTIGTSPNIAVTQSGTLCSPNGASLTATGGGTYFWSNQAATATTNVTAAGNYTVTVTSTTGCTAATSIAVTACSGLTVTIAGDRTICTNACTALTASATGGTGTAYTYVWSNQTTTPANSICAVGTYTVTATNSAGGTGTASVTITQLTAPTAAITGPTATCAGTAVTLTASGGGTYLWGTQATTAAITVTPTAITTYSVQVTGANGCKAYASQSVNVNLPPTGAITSQGSTCSPNGLMLTAPTSASVWTWNTGATSPFITVFTGGTYTVTISNGTGCTSTATKVVTAATPPVVTTAQTGTLCSGTTGVAIAATVTGTGVFTYSWNNGATTASTTVTAAGIYTVTVTNADGCTGTGAVTVAACSPITVTVTGNLSPCTGTCTALLAAATGAPAPATYTFAWSNQIQGNTNSVCPTTVTTYIVTATANNGATGTKVVVVTPTNPTFITIDGPTSVCLGKATTMTAVFTAGQATPAFAWSNGATTAAITVTPTATTTYTVTSTNSAGCTATATKTVSINALPTASITGNTTYCASSNNVDFIAAGGGTYLWNNQATTAVIVVTAGTYTVTVTNTAGCTATASRTVTMLALPTAAATQTGSLCNGVVAMTATGGGTYAWSNQATTASTNVTAAGTYTVTVTGTNGCTKTATVAVAACNALQVSIVGGGDICVGNCVSLFTSVSGGTAPYAYNWSNQATTASPQVCPTATTTYTVTVTSSTGATGTANVTVSVSPRPTLSIAGAALTCTNPIATLTPTTTGATSIVWSTGATTSTISVTAVGTYTATVTNAAGCTASASVAVTENRAVPTVAITGNTVLCANTATVLTAAATPTGQYTYAWAGSASNILTITAAGTYTVTVTNTANGCTTTKSMTVTAGTAPTVAVTQTGNLCSGTSGVSLAATGGGTYLWSNQATTATTTVTAAGIYTVTVTGTNGCTRSSTITVVACTPLTVTVTGTTSVCAGSCTALTAAATGGSAGVTYTYLWSSSTGTGGATTQVCPTATTTYTVTATASTGATGTIVVTVTVNPRPTVIAQSSNPLTCNTPTTTLSISATGGAVFTYAWSNATTLPQQTVTSAGVYTVTVTNEFGCSTAASVTVTSNFVAPIANAGADQVLTCSTQSVTIGSTAVSGNTYSWGNNIITSTRQVTAAGIYTVTVTNTANGCTATDVVIITQNITAPTAAITGATELNCLRPSTVLTASGGGTYLWSNQATTASITVANIGTFTVTVTNPVNGCTATATKTITANTALPAAGITQTTTGCPNTAVTLQATGGGTYAWSTAATTAAISVSNANVYTVTVTGTNGCSKTATKAATFTSGSACGGGTGRAATNNGTVIEVTAAPNPGNAALTLTFGESPLNNATITVFDINGRRVAQTHHTIIEAGSTVALDASDWASGMYLILITNNTTHQTLKWIKE
jgi:hypothetical protein